jgi:hypothetical protein
MININDPSEFADLMVRVQARRVAQCYAGAGRTIPSGAAAVLAGDTEETLERDSEAFAAWREASRPCGCSGYRISGRSKGEWCRFCGDAPNRPC